MRDIERRIKALEATAARREAARANIQSVNVCDHIAPVYLPLHADLTAEAHQYYNLPGGRGSAKSSFVSLEIVNGIMQDPTGCSNAIVFRRTANTMRESVFSQIAWAIDTLDVNQYWRGNVSPMSWTYLPTGAQILFRGLDDSSKLKSIKPKKGYFGYCWFEEATDFQGLDEIENIVQSVARSGLGKTAIFLSYNPPQSVQSWINAEVLRPQQNRFIHHSTYLSIRPDLLG
jgi:PBSX family phage terminase large subunit